MANSTINTKKNNIKKTTHKKITVKKTVKINKATPEITVCRKKKILFVASEAMPFIASGGLAEVIGSLPKSLNKISDYDIRVIIPLYSDIQQEKRALLKYEGHIYIPLAWRNQYCGIFSTVFEGVKIYFIDNEYYFKRPGLYGYYDDAERFAFFSKSVLEIMPFIDFYPDIIHSNDWHTALVPIYLKTIYSYKNEYKNIKSVFTIHNIEYQGKYSTELLEDVFGISKENLNLLEYNGLINLMKGAIECSEVFTTVSPNYAKEIKNPYYASGLDEIINRNEFKLKGILNGIDVDYYNSEKDKTLFSNFNSDNFEGKKKCKSELQKMLNLPMKDDVPVIAMITRLASHKGVDLLREVMEDILKENIQFVLLGTGESKYENYFVDLSNKYKGKLSVIIAFNNDLSRKIYSGADLFLMPSKTEPCGLSQMIASRYATIPIVRETGGLYDSIKPVGLNGIGFTFANYNAHDMLYVVKEAINIYSDKQEFKKIMERAIKTDFSWEHSAKEYLSLYSDMTK
jgi:starch synthase